MGKSLKEELKINGAVYSVEVHQHEEFLPCLMMLHGFMGDRRVFSHLIKDLCNFCNPVTVDLLGHGKSEKSFDARRYREEHQIEDIITVIKQVDSSPPVFLYGYSMGGRLALKTALFNPDLFTGLILESTNCGITDEEKRKKRQQIDKKRAANILQDFEAFLENWKELELFHSPLSVNEQLAETYHTIQSEQEPQSLSASLRGFGTGTMRPMCDKLNAFQKPVLLLAGSADEKYQRLNRRMLKKIPNATFHSVEAGHRIHIDNSKTLLTEIKTFLKTHSP